MKVLLIILFTVFFTGCSSFNSTSDTLSSHPLKTKNDLQVENTLTNGTWKYVPQFDDCKDTSWTQNFYVNRYYKSVGDACLIPNAFSVGAENWHIKHQILYITNLSPLNGDDIVIKYGIDFLSNNSLILSSGDYKYTFKR